MEKSEKKRSAKNGAVELKNLTCLAEGCVYPTSLKETGINSNEIIIGPTRSGKTTSVIEPKLLHTFEGSLVINVTKRDLVDRYAPIFKKRGYRVWDLNFVDPDKGNVCYDPLYNLKKETDIISLAETIVKCDDVGEKQKTNDHYWDDSAVSALVGMIGLTKFMNEELVGRRLSFKHLLDTYNEFRFNIDENDNVVKERTSLDTFFRRFEMHHPNNMYCKAWRTATVLPQRTAACVFSSLNGALDKLFNSEVMKVTYGKEKIDFEQLGSEKTVLFVTTSPVNKSMQKLLTIFFADAFRSLFEYAEKRPSKELPLPVHLICDDFATGGRIPDFHEYLSVFCAKGISVSLLLQSESQLTGIYGDHEAKTIINQCDTYVYFGGMDHLTCDSISRRANIPLEDVYCMPLEQVILFRRGSRPVIAHRYRTYDDPLYKELFAGESTARKKENREEERL